jgi:hypothetical protein
MGIAANSAVILIVSNYPIAVAYPAGA